MHPSFHQRLAFALWLFVMLENYQVKFSLSEDNQPKSIPSDITTKTIFHVVDSVLWRFNLILRDQNKLFFMFYWHKISLSIDNLLLCISFSCNLLILGYSPSIEQSRISYFEGFSTLRYPTSEITPPSPMWHHGH